MKIKGSVFIIIVVMLVLFCCFELFNSLSSVKTKNADVSFSDDAEVGFRAVCPKCNHQGKMYIARISKGENYTKTEACEKCWEIFEIEVKR